MNEKVFLRLIISNYFRESASLGLSTLSGTLNGYSIELSPIRTIGPRGLLKAVGRYLSSPQLEQYETSASARVFPEIGRMKDLLQKTGDSDSLGVKRRSVVIVTTSAEEVAHVDSLLFLFLLIFLGSLSCGRGTAGSGGG